MGGVRLSFLNNVEAKLARWNRKTREDVGHARKSGEKTVCEVFFVGYCAATKVDQNSFPWFIESIVTKTFCSGVLDGTLNQNLNWWSQPYTFMHSLIENIFNHPGLVAPIAVILEQLVINAVLGELWQGPLMTNENLSSTDCSRSASTGTTLYKSPKAGYFYCKQNGQKDRRQRDSLVKLRDKCRRHRCSLSFFSQVDISLNLPVCTSSLLISRYKTSDSGEGELCVFRDKKNLTVLHLGNHSFKTAGDYRMYNLRDTLTKYDQLNSKYIAKMGTRMIPQMKTLTFSPFEPISIIKFLKNFKLALDSSDVHKNAAMLLFHCLLVTLHPLC